MGPLRADALLGLDGSSPAFFTTPTDLEVTGEVELSERRPVLVRGEIPVKTEQAFEVLDVTELAEEFVERAGIVEGSLLVYTPHTTCAVKINERESGFIEDLRVSMERLAPADAYYRHDDFDIRTENLEDPATEPINGHAHVKSMLLGSSSEHVPVVDGVLALGRWQRILFIELDQARPRRVVLQAEGWR